MDKVQPTSPASEKPSQRSRLPQPAIDLFRDEFYNKNNTYPKTAELQQWAIQFGMKESSAHTWFAQHRQRAKKALSSASIKEQQDLEEIDAAKREFAYLKEELVLRLVHAFHKQHYPPQKLPELAVLMKIPEKIIAEYASWKLGRDKALYDAIVPNPSFMTGGQALIGHPSTNMPSTHMQLDTSFKPDDDEMMDFLPTPRDSAETPSSTRPQSLEPDVVFTSFYEVWQAIRAQESQPQTMADNTIPAKDILQSLIPASLANFAKSSHHTP